MPATSPIRWLMISTSTLDVEGQGVLYFARYNHWHGKPLALRR